MTEFVKDQTVYSIHLKQRVTIIRVGGEYATVEDSRGNTITVHISTLQTLDWTDGAEVLEREA